MDETKRKLKVLYITHYDTFYGANLSMLHLIRDMRERHDVVPYVLYCPGGGDLAETLEKEHIEALPVEYRNTWNIVVNSRNRLFKCIKKCVFPVRAVRDEWYNRKAYYPAILKTVREIAPDIIHTNTSVSHLGYYLSRELGIPHIWHVREYGERDYGLYFVRGKRLTDKAFSSAKYVVAISKAISEHYSKITPNTKLITIYNGIAPFSVEKERADQVTFCCIGLITQKKNQMEILKAACLLREKCAGQFRVTFVGDGDETYIQQMKDIIRENDMQEFVDFAGYQSDVKPWLRRADVGIMSSVSEAFGRVTVEYMLAEMPVIGTNSGGTAEIILPNETGFLYESGDYAQLAEYMAYFVRNRAQIGVLGQAGRQRALAHFSIGANTDQIFALYQNAMAELT